MIVLLCQVKCLNIFPCGGLLVVLGLEDDMVVASLVCHEPWIFHGCVVIASQVLEKILSSRDCSSSSARRMTC